MTKHLGSLSHPRENSDTVEGTRSFLVFRAEQRRSSEDFLLGGNPPSQQHINVSAPLLVSLYKNLAPRTQGLACVSTSEDCEFLPCSGEHHFLGTDRNLNLSNVEYITNKSLDILREEKCQFYNSPSPQGIRPEDQKKVNRVLTSNLDGVQGTHIISRSVTEKFCYIFKVRRF